MLKSIKIRNAVYIYYVCGKPMFFLSYQILKLSVYNKHNDRNRWIQHTRMHMSMQIETRNSAHAIAIKFPTNWSSVFIHIAVLISLIASYCVQSLIVMRYTRPKYTRENVFRYLCYLIWHMAYVRFKRNTMAVVYSPITYRIRAKKIITTLSSIVTTISCVLQ